MNTSRVTPTAVGDTAAHVAPTSPTRLPLRVGTMGDHTPPVINRLLLERP